jgi:hypothetical protein
MREDPPRLSFMGGPPVYTCPKGHESPSVSFNVCGKDGKQIVSRPCCAVCLVNWLGDTFPIVVPDTPER